MKRIAALAAGDIYYYAAMNRDATGHARTPLLYKGAGTPARPRYLLRWRQQRHSVAERAGTAGGDSRER